MPVIMNERIAVKDEDLDAVEKKYVELVEQKLRLADMVSAVLREALTERAIEVEKAKDGFRQSVEDCAKKYDVPDEGKDGIVWELSRLDGCFIRQVVEPSEQPTGAEGSAIEITSE